MIKSLFIAGFVALATASPAYYGYSSKHSQPSYAPKETYHEVPKASYSSYKPSYGGGHEGGHSGGYGGGYGHYEKPHPYNFGYQIDDGYGANTHQEEEGDDYGNKRGSYGYTDAYGIYRKVDYVADGYGFRAKVSTNEPGTADQDPADVKLYAQEPPHQAYDHAPKYQASYAKPSYGGGYHKESYGGHDGGYDGGYGGGHGGGYGGDHRGYAVSVGHYGGGGHKGGYGHGGYSKGYGGHSKQHFKMLHPKYESKY